MVSFSVHDVLPILLRNQTLKLSETICLELFRRAARFYLSVLSSSQRRKTSTTSSGAGTASSSSGAGSPRASRFKSSRLVEFFKNVLFTLNFSFIAVVVIRLLPIITIIISRRAPAEGADRATTIGNRYCNVSP